MTLTVEQLEELERDLPRVIARNLTGDFYGAFLATEEQARIAATVKAILDLIPTARQAGEVGEGWQPIETAPRDGTVVLVYRLPDWRAVPVVPAFWCDEAEGLVCAEMRRLIRQPTHWRPLPDPPLISPSLSSVKGEENGTRSSGSLEPVRAGARAPNETLEGRKP